MDEGELLEPLFENAPVYIENEAHQRRVAVLQHLNPQSNSINAVRLHATTWEWNISHLWRVMLANPYRVLMSSAFMIGSICVLVWNEGIAVKISQSLDEGHNQVITVTSAEQILPENEGKVVHLSGKLSTYPPLSDLQFNVEIEAVRLKRRVQVYQWVEGEEVFYGDQPTVGHEPVGDVSYSYRKAWRDKLIDSDAFNIPFGHENPKSFPLQSEILFADDVKIGAYALSKEIVDTFTTYKTFSGDEEPPTDDVRLHAGMYYVTRDIFNPAVGDVRIQFYYAGHAGYTYSVVGVQEGGTLRAYTSSSSGHSLVLLQAGQRTPDEMFATQHAHTRFRCWAYRILGFCLLCAAVTAGYPVVITVVCWWRALRDVAAMSGGHFTMTVAMSLSLTTVAVSWFFYRPGMAVCLVLLAMLPAVKGGYTGGVRNTSAHDGR